MCNRLLLANLLGSNTNQSKTTFAIATTLIIVVYVGGFYSVGAEANFAKGLPCHDLSDLMTSQHLCSVYLPPPLRYIKIAIPLGTILFH